MHPSVQPLDAAAYAAARVAQVADDPAGRLALLRASYDGPFEPSVHHRPFRRAALSFMGWELRRGVLEPASAPRPGSPWWRALNERLLHDSCETVARAGGAGGEPSSETIEPWMAFVAEPNAANWYRAHNASIVAAYLEHRGLAERENRAERFFFNVVLLRVLTRTRWSPRRGWRSAGCGCWRGCSATRDWGWRGSSCRCGERCQTSTRCRTRWRTTYGSRRGLAGRLTTP